MNVSTTTTTTTTTTKQKIYVSIFQANSGGNKKAVKGHVKDKQAAFQHAWLLTSLKGHSGRVLDVSFSENGKMVATTADDRTGKNSSFLDNRRLLMGDHGFDLFISFF
jgi:WD40 repeat protein